MLILEGDKIKQVTAFIMRTIDLPSRDDFATWPAQPSEPERVNLVFARLGLPTRLD